ncbi:hypothetical protein [Desulfovibrio sp. JC010]|uniref:hypothetical protein n=1 Tax=Desulfovibrio sp. JC010 TaxID=2593641 RepID=UPI0013D87029|nr:hypothetical protein [Desulfovibrio sp. JC010]NDV28098.1 hypothetical protein [Desulfovibrio sp. JC010]
MSADSGPPWPGFVDALSTVLMMMVFFTLLMVLVTGTLSYIVALKEVTPGAATSTEQVETKVAAAQDLSFMEKPSSMDQLAAAMSQSAALEKEDLVSSPPPQRFDIKEFEREKEMLQKRVALAESAAWTAHLELQKLKEEQQKIQSEQDPKLAEKLKDALEKIKRLEASGAEEKKVQTEDEYVPPPFITKLVKGMNNRHRVIILYNKLTSTLEEKTQSELLAWIKQNESVVMQKGLLLTATLNHESVSSSMANSVSFKRLYGLIKFVNEQANIPKSKIKFRALNEGVPGTNQVVVSIGSSFTKSAKSTDLNISVKK